MRIPLPELFEKYRKNLYAVAFNLCKNAHDAEDVVQDTFMQYALSRNEYDDVEHIRAWLIRVAINKAKNINLAFWRKNVVPLEDFIRTLTFETPESQNLFEAVMQLPAKYRVVIHLFYHEDYSVREIADILRISENNVKVRLSRGRAMLKAKLLEEWSDDEPGKV